MTTRRMVATTLSLIAIMSATSAHAAVDLLSHRAAYRLSLNDLPVAGGVTSVDGALVMEWRASCEGWISNQRLGFIADTADGGDFIYDVRFSSWESLDNSRLRFNVRTFDGGQLFEEYRGKAQLSEFEKGGVAEYVEPDETMVELPSGTIFPTEHMRRLVEAALRGDLVVSHEVFDGSGPDALSTVSAVIGQGLVSTAPDDADEQRWPVSLAYYSDEDGVGTPEFQISFDLTAEGVLHDIVLDYGDFALRGELEVIEAYDDPVCD